MGVGMGRGIVIGIVGVGARGAAVGDAGARVVHAVECGWVERVAEYCPW